MQSGHVLVAKIALEGKVALLFDHNKAAEKSSDLPCLDQMKLRLLKIITRVKSNDAWLHYCFYTSMRCTSARGEQSLSGNVGMWAVEDKPRGMILPHSFMGSSDPSLQSFTLSHTLLLSMHSPFLQRNFLGPSHLVTAVKEKHTNTRYKQILSANNTLPTWRKHACMFFWSWVQILFQFLFSVSISIFFLKILLIGAINMWGSLHAVQFVQLLSHLKI